MDSSGEVRERGMDGIGCGGVRRWAAGEHWEVRRETSRADELCDALRDSLVPPLVYDWRRVVWNSVDGFGKTALPLPMARLLRHYSTDSLLCVVFIGPTDVSSDQITAHLSRHRLHSPDTERIGEPLVSYERTRGVSAVDRLLFLQHLDINSNFSMLTPPQLSTGATSICMHQLQSWE